ncbi:MAG: hypothetical protein QOD63_58 [Actinomycetota bacterium]|nr:hypothetical protein [Actinomycetota bacterium]
MRPFEDELAAVRAREAVAELAADVVELRARNLCRGAEPHGARAVPCPFHVQESRRQLGEEARR